MVTTDLVDRLRPKVDATIASLRMQKFRVDPIAGETYSRLTSIISAAYKRHGQIIEVAIRERLSDCDYLTVWHEPEFKISGMADATFNSRNDNTDPEVFPTLPYGDAARAIQVDAFVVDRRANTFRGYEIKRANGHFDSGKKRSIKRDLYSIQSLMEKYGKNHGVFPGLCEARLIAFYGVRPFSKPLCITGDEIDDHFAFLVKSHVDRVNDYFRERLYMLISDIAGDEANSSLFQICAHCPFTTPERDTPGSAPQPH